jgi:hypothetical protein
MTMEGWETTSVKQNHLHVLWHHMQITKYLSHDIIFTQNLKPNPKNKKVKGALKWKGKN